MPPTVSTILEMRLQKTHDQFVSEANLIHNNKYTYPNRYIKSTTKLGIMCPIHGLFDQRPYSHLAGNGCKRCDIEQRSSSNTLTHVQFIERAHKIHDNKYEYLDTYVNSQSLINITCTIHGEFQQYPYLHLLGHGCPHCRHKFNKRIPSKQSGGNGCYSIRYFEKYPENIEIKGFLYVLELTIEDQQYIKIGITKNIKSRLRNYTKFNGKEVAIIENSLYNVFLIEQKLLFQLSKERKILNPFPGYTECITYSPQNINEILEYLHQYNPFVFKY